MLVEFLKEYLCHRIGAVVALPGGVADALIRRGICRPAPAAGKKAKGRA